MWVKSVVKFMLVLHFVILSSQSEANEAAAASETDLSTLPNIWEDEVVSRMIREVLARDLVKEHEHRHFKRQHKRDVTASPAVVAATTKKVQTTRKSPATTQKAKKPIKVTQTGNKIKNRVASSTSTPKATVKPSIKPIVAHSNLGVSGINSLSKSKVRTK